MFVLFSGILRALHRDQIYEAAAKELLQHIHQQEAMQTTAPVALWNTHGRPFKVLNPAPLLTGITESYHNRQELSNLNSYPSF